MADDNFTLGISGYSSNGKTGSDVEVGEGSPRSGVLPWMEEDEFKVFGGYFEGKIRQFTFQTAYWVAHHDATRDPASVLTVLNNTTLNTNQYENFLIIPDNPFSESNVATEAEYDVETWYLRTAYSFETKWGEIMSYIQYD